MTVLVGSKWVMKRNVNLWAFVIQTLVHRGVKHVIYEVFEARYKVRSPELHIMSVRTFTTNYKHPEPDDDIPEV